MARPEEQACSMKVAFILVMRPVITLSSTVMPLNSAMFWKVRAMPCIAAMCGSILRRSSPWKDDAAFLG